MAMHIIKLSLLIQALMGHTLVNQIIVKLNSLIEPGNPLWTSLESLFIKHCYTHLCVSSVLH